MSFCIGSAGFDTYVGIDPNLAELRQQQEIKYFRKKKSTTRRVFLEYKKIAKDTERIIVQTRYHLHEDCPLCLDDMFDKKVKYLPCGHAFCLTCLQKQVNSKCPSKYKCASCRRGFVSCIIRQNEARENMQSILGMRRLVDYPTIDLDYYQSYRISADEDYNNERYGYGLSAPTNINNTNLVEQLQEQDTSYYNILNSLSQLISFYTFHDEENISSHSPDLVQRVINDAIEYNNITTSLEGGDLVMNILGISNIPNDIHNLVANSLNDHIIDNLTLTR